MCDFAFSKKLKFVKHWRRGYKITTLDHTGWYFNVKIQPNVHRRSRNLHSGMGPQCPFRRPDTTNFVGFYIYLDREGAFSKAQERKVEEVWFKGWCVFGEDGLGNQGVRAEWCVFRKTRRQWRRTSPTFLYARCDR